MFEEKDSSDNNTDQENTSEDAADASSQQVDSPFAGQPSPPTSQQEAEPTEDIPPVDDSNIAPAEQASSESDSPPPEPAPQSPASTYNPLLAQQQTGGVFDTIWRLKKAILLVLLPFVIAGVMAYTVPHFIDWDAQKHAIVKSVRDVTGRDLAIRGDIKFTAFPRPMFTISDVKLKNAKGGDEEFMLTASSTEVFPSIPSLIVGNVSIQDVSVNNLAVYLENYTNEMPNWDFAAGRPVPQSANTRKVLDKYSDLSAITIHNGEFYIRSGPRNDVVARLIKLDKAVVKARSLSGPFTIEGSFISRITSLDYRFELEVGDLSDKEGADLEALLYTGNSQLALEGTLRNWQDNASFQGKLQGDIDRSVQDMADYLGFNEQFLPGTMSSLLTNNKTHIEGDVQLDNGLVRMAQIQIDSPVTKGSGSFEANFNQEIADIELALKFQEVQFDQSVSGRAAGGKNGKDTKFVKKLQGRSQFDVTQNIRMFLDLQADRATLNNHTINDFAIKFELRPGLAAIKSLKAEKLPGNSSVFIEEAAANNDDSGQKRFLSTIKASGSSLRQLLEWLRFDISKIATDKLGAFNAEGKMFVDADKVSISKLLVKLDDVAAVAKATFSKDDEGLTTANIALGLQKFSTDEYFTSPEDQVSAEDFDEVKLLRRFDVLRRMQLYFDKVAVALKINELEFQGNNFTNVSSTFYLKPNILKVKKFEVTLPNGKIFTGGFGVDVTELRPKVVLSVSAEEFDTAFFFPESKNISFNKAPQWSTDEFSLQAFGGADMRAVFKFNRLIHGPFTFKKVKSNLTIDKEAINISSFRARIFSGNLDLKAVLGVQRPSFSVSYSIASAKFSEMLETLFGAKILSAGRVSLGGSMSTVGTNMRSLLAELNGSANITARGIKLKGFQFSDIYEEAALIQQVDELRSFVNKALGRGESEVDYMAGNVFVNNGKISLKDIALTHFMLRQGSLSLNANLVDWTINANTLFRVNLKNGPDVPLILTTKGSIEKPKYIWDKRGVEEYWEKKFYSSRP